MKFTKIIPSHSFSPCIELMKNKYQAYNNESDNWNGECDICEMETPQAIKLCSGDEFYSVFICHDCLTISLAMINASLGGK